MAIRATVSRFPIDADAQEASGLQWGVTVSPFSLTDENGIAPVYGNEVDGSEEEAMQARPVYVAAVDLSLNRKKW
ncbi:hypothetical protein C5167_046856 [Papaver somniferum]|uniref:Uncharacterized protein n=1 Tax=Papaver somniferum TaxID=3469 RepID=A0A4Y7LHE6_PAPSO|nr:hypothetical protein C5167_046856 [Papaver somniferum]